MVRLKQKVSIVFMALILSSLLIFSPAICAERSLTEMSSGESSSEVFMEREGGDSDISEELKELKIGDIMNPDPTTVKIDATVEEAAGKMEEQNIDCLAVVGEDKSLSGVITENDFLDKLKPLSGSCVGYSQVRRAEKKSADYVNQLMTSDPITLSPDSSVEKLVKMMSAYDLRHMPVTVDGELVGMVTVRELLRVFQNE